MSLAEQFLKYFTSGCHKLCNFYGSTEIMGDVTYHVIQSHDDIAFKDKVPIGKSADKYYVLFDRLKQFFFFYKAYILLNQRKVFVLTQVNPQF